MQKSETFGILNGKGLTEENYYTSVGRLEESNVNTEITSILVTAGSTYNLGTEEVEEGKMWSYQNPCAPRRGW